MGRPYVSLFLKREKMKKKIMVLTTFIILGITHLYPASTAAHIDRRLNQTIGYTALNLRINTSKGRFIPIMKGQIITFPSTILSALPSIYTKKTGRKLKISYSTPLNLIINVKAGSQKYTLYTVTKNKWNAINAKAAVQATNNKIINPIKNDINDAKNGINQIEHTHINIPNF